LVFQYHAYDLAYPVSVGLEGTHGTVDQGLTLDAAEGAEFAAPILARKRIDKRQTLMGRRLFHRL
jgi:hypothetical protein